MNPAEKIENLLNTMNVTPDTNKDRKMLEAILEAQAETKRQTPDNPKPEIWRLIMKKRIPQFAAAAIVLIVLLLSLTLGPGQSAYAEVANELRKARTLAYTLIRQTNVKPGQTVSLQVAQKEPCYLRTTTVDGYICIVDASQGKMLSLVPTNQTYTTAEFENVPVIEGQDPFEEIRKLKELPANADEELGEMEIDGVTASGFRVFKTDTTLTIWINAQTGELIQIEYEYPSSEGMNFIMRNIQLDVELDDSLFSLTPPEGYSLGVNLKADVSKINEDNFIGFFRTWIDLTVDKTFPPTFWSPEFAKIVMEMAKAGKFEKPWTPEDAQMIYQGMMFLSQISENDWRYVGQNVPFGDPETPVFWYRFPGSEMWRIIYADLSVAEVAADELPQ